MTAHPAPTNRLQELTKNARERLLESFPSQAELLIPFSKSLSDFSETSPSSAFTEVNSEITRLEYQEILQKLAGLCTLADPLEQDQQLYLEQQLTDLLGFQVSSELTNISLSSRSGRVAACAHLKRTPTDSLSQHRMQAAGLRQSRSRLGWFAEHGALSPDRSQREEYWVSLPTSCFQDWSLHQERYTTWCRTAKILLVNPFEERAVVCAVGDTFPATVQFQFGASPEVIREGMFWSKLTAGKSLIFFVDDAHNKVSLGPVSLAQGGC